MTNDVGEVNISNEVEFVFEEILEGKYYYVSDVYKIITMQMEKKRNQCFFGTGLGSMFINEKGDIYTCQLFEENIRLLGAKL